MPWTVEYYSDAKGREPVAEFLDSLPIGTQAKVFRVIDLLAKYHVLLKEPYTKQIKGKIRELRVADAMGRFECSTSCSRASDSFCSMGLSRRQGKRQSARLVLPKTGCRII